MPIYEYRRPDGTTFELQQTFSEESLTTDPETGVPVVRVLHAPAVHFKGKGFYNTDYGTRSRQREAAAEKSSEAEKKSTESSTAKSSDGSSTSTKPAKPTEKAGTLAKGAKAAPAKG